MNGDKFPLQIDELILTVPHNPPAAELWRQTYVIETTPEGVVTYPRGQGRAENYNESQRSDDGRGSEFSQSLWRTAAEWTYGGEARPPPHLGVRHCTVDEDGAFVLTLEVGHSLKVTETGLVTSNTAGWGVPSASAMTLEDVVRSLRERT